MPFLRKQQQQRLDTATQTTVHLQVNNNLSCQTLLGKLLRILPCTLRCEKKSSNLLNWNNGYCKIAWGYNVRKESILFFSSPLCFIDINNILRKLLFSNTMESRAKSPRRISSP
mmetsp:Transcript_24280/g.45205  ORF Transcript_24280/g.45205 Transcript_24280/m.45205 type:complete len:114 (+) Transcript_24280:709-1050(+)